MNTHMFPEFFTEECFKNESPVDIQKKVDALLSVMTREEKMGLCHGWDNPDGGQIANAGYLPGIPRFGVPEIRMYDGPAGVTSIHETTGLPVQEALAASWDKKLAYEYGAIEGSENFAISGNTQLGSQYDMVRTPHFMRVQDMLGEDPFLTSALAVEETKGIQDNHAVATLKHFFAASVSTDDARKTMQQVDEQTLHELYFPPFEAAIRQGNAAAVMSTYNRINGSYASANEYAMKDVLRNMWGFKGYTMSDWGANHSLSVQKGLDMEMPRGIYNSNARIEKGLGNGRLCWDDVENAARHVLYGLGMVGYLSLVALDENGTPLEEKGRTKPIKMQDQYSSSEGLFAENARKAELIAEKGAVLLKNRDALPVKVGEKIAMIGLGAVNLISGYGQERSYGTLRHMISPVSAMKQLEPKLEVSAEVGIDIIGETVPEQYLWQDEKAVKKGVVRTWGVDKSQRDPSIFPEIDFDDMPAGAPPENIGGQGLELVGTAKADEDEDDSDVEPFTPGWINTIAKDIPGHITGDFCRIDKTLDFTCGTINGATNQTYRNSQDGTALTYGEAYTWEGYLRVPASGIYTLILEGIGGLSRLEINTDGRKYRTIGTTCMREGAHWPWASLICTPEGMEIHAVNVYLKANESYPIRMCANASDPNKDLQLRFAWITPERRKEQYEKALLAAADSDKVVFFLTGDYAPTELGKTANMMDAMYKPGSLQPPADQLELLYQVKLHMRPEAKLIVIINYGRIFTTSQWEDVADSIMDVWYPGQGGGIAIAKLLLGQANPSGKLPVSIPKTDTDTPVSDTPDHMLRRYEGCIGEDGKCTINFEEGIFTGYRWYDKTETIPAYPFGHGLSYTTFAYSDLRVSGCDVTFTVTNTGDAVGTEIAQVYIGAAEVPDHIQMAKKMLCGFARLEEIKPGEQRTVTISIPDRSFCYWDPKAPMKQVPDGTKGKWIRPRGKRSVYVGASAEKLLLSGELMVE